MTLVVDSQIAVRPLQPTLGGEVSGVDLHQPLDGDAVQQLRQALLERKVLVFRDQHLDPEELVTFSRSFGEPFVRDQGYEYGYLEGNKYVGKLGPSPVGQRPSAWHQGGTWKTNPWPFELLQLNVVPAVGGDTLFADLGAAYRDLSAPLQEALGQLRTAHRTQVATRGPRGEDEPFVVHPLVINHPETGARQLYLTSRITHILDIPKAESDFLLSFLQSHASHLNYHYRNSWNAGDLVIWDNRAVWHYAVDDYGDAERWGYKISIEGGDWQPQ